ncbi:TAFII55 protein conserved region-domain-containing protein [Penicillium cosmopolitanum]|uniref:TAFII55 protein conserved region-domain-containing protein n=1 Tax=Penicillium cosmopolitanum TaxID=1131564 RepID=A0A9W9W6Q1_9EURO|nr:TAFII55 protein conserved region-domain-containing protein [Penicillium cosmopolitanum]KAJ5404435.1 TAFII55 protein conserved region-domain-containing protein [Penicillium cosmopolitanum]
MSDTPRPMLKLKFGKKPSQPPGESASTPTPAPAPATPATASPAEPQRKITLKIGRKPQANPQPDPPTTEKEKPKKKKASTKKRPADNVAQLEPAPTTQLGPKRLKLNPSKKPGLQSIRIKNKQTVPTRPVGVGYDSEASDTEADPAIEEQFILRMLPGDDCEYLRQAITERKFDKSEFSFKPLTRDARRAILKIRDKQYAAAMVDLPTITEGMKSWDRRGWYKSADISQMLLVLGPVANEEEAMKHEVPQEVLQPDTKTLQYPHGLAPPLRWVRKRRFRDRLSARTIEQVEKSVEDLVAQDEESVFPPRFEVVDSSSLNRGESFVNNDEYYEEYDDEQDAEGEVEDEMMDDFDDDLAGELEAALAGDGDDDQPPPTANGGPEQEGTPSAKPSTPAGPGYSSGESDVSDEDEDLDDDQVEQQQLLQQHREEIAELENLIKNETAQWEKVQNAILRQKMSRRIQELKKDLELKKVSAGLPGDTDI